MVMSTVIAADKCDEWDFRPGRAHLIQGVDFNRPREDRQTFEYPEGWYPQRDTDGRATGWVIRESDGKRLHASDPFIKALLPAAPIRKPVIWWDMDGVLADFDGRARQLLGTEDIHMWEFTYGPEKFWAALNAYPQFFASLDPMPGFERLRPHVKHVLTALPRADRRDVDAQKRAWIAKYTTGGEPEVVTCLTKEKVNYVQPGDVLVDDRAVSQDAILAKGGRFILHRSAEDTLARLRAYGYIGGEA